MKAGLHVRVPQFWSRTTMATRGNQHNSLGEQMGLGLSHQTLAALSGGSVAGI
jgi:hypothetical protein